MRYCISDLHGNYEIWQQVRDYLNEDDTLYVLGDVIDRGKYGIKILQEMFEDKRVINLMGNHEDMLLQAMVDIPQLIYDYKNTFLGKYRGSNWLWYNGGDVTLEYMINHMTLDEMEQLCKKIAELPLYIDLTIGDKEIWLSHSGYRPPVGDKDRYPAKTYLWNREHLRPFDDWSINSDYQNVVEVFGHTPVVSMEGLAYGMESLTEEDRGRIEKYNDYNKILDNPSVARIAGGHKIDIDMGTPSTGVSCLYCLDNDSTRYFYDEELHKKWIR